jgi:hypothetical protein
MPIRQVFLVAGLTRKDLKNASFVTQFKSADGSIPHRSNRIKLNDHYKKQLLISEIKMLK